MTYIVLPRMQPSYNFDIVSFICAGAIQLFVGPASLSFTEQIKVRSSTRATSVGSDAHQKEFGFFFSGTSVPAFTKRSVISFHSASLPLHK